MTAAAHRAPAPGLPAHHPPQAFLVDYAAGSAAEPVALIVAAHLTLCPSCRDRVRRLEAIGGVLLEALPSAPVAGDALDAVLARIDRPDPPAPLAPANQDDSLDPALPAPLRAYLGCGLDRVAWRPVVRRRMDEYRLPVAGGGSEARLVRIRAGAAAPRHTHEGHELTLVLAGSFTDELGRYGRGDMMVIDGSVDHRPVSGPGADCVCLVVTDGPLRLTGPFGWLLTRFGRF